MHANARVTSCTTMVMLALAAADAQGQVIQVNYSTPVPLSPALAAAIAIVIGLVTLAVMRRWGRFGRISSWLLAGVFAASAASLAPRFVDSAYAVPVNPNIPINTNPTCYGPAFPPGPYNFQNAAGGGITITAVTLIPFAPPTQALAEPASCGFAAQSAKAVSPNVLTDIDRQKSTCAPGAALAVGDVCSVYLTGGAG